MFPVMSLFVCLSAVQHGYVGQEVHNLVRNQYKNVTTAIVATVTISTKNRIKNVLIMRLILFYFNLKVEVRKFIYSVHKYNSWLPSCYCHFGMVGLNITGIMKIAIPSVLCVAFEKKYMIMSASLKNFQKYISTKIYFQFKITLVCLLVRLLRIEI